MSMTMEEEFKRWADAVPEIEISTILVNLVVSIDLPGDVIAWADASNI